MFQKSQAWYRDMGLVHSGCSSVCDYDDISLIASLLLGY